MYHAEITGWGKCVPPAVLSNDDLATFIDTSDDWITSRTGIRERRRWYAFSPAGDFSVVHVVSPSYPGRLFQFSSAIECKRINYF